MQQLLQHFEIVVTAVIAVVVAAFAVAIPSVLGKVVTLVVETGARVALFASATCK